LDSGLALVRFAFSETARSARRVLAATFALLIVGLGKAAHAAPWPRVLAGSIFCGDVLLRRQASHPLAMLAAGLRPIGRDCCMFVRGARARLRVTSLPVRACPSGHNIRQTIEPSEKR